MRAIFLSVDGPHLSRATSTTSSYIGIMTHTHTRTKVRGNGGVNDGGTTKDQGEKKEKGVTGLYHDPTAFLPSVFRQCVGERKRESEPVCVCVCMAMATASWLRCRVLELCSTGRESHADKQRVLLECYLHFFSFSYLILSLSLLAGLQSPSPFSSCVLTIYPFWTWFSIFLTLKRPHRSI